MRSDLWKFEETLPKKSLVFGDLEKMKPLKLKGWQGSIENKYLKGIIFSCEKH